MGNLFQDLLTVSESDDGRLVNDPQLIDVNEFLAKAVELGESPGSARATLESARNTSGGVQ